MKSPPACDILLFEIGCFMLCGKEGIGHMRGFDGKAVGFHSDYTFLSVISPSVTFGDSSLV